MGGILNFSASLIMQVQHGEVQQPIWEVKSVVALRICHQLLHQPKGHKGFFMSQRFNKVLHELCGLNIRIYNVLNVVVLAKDLHLLHHMRHESLELGGVELISQTGGLAKMVNSFLHVFHAALIFHKGTVGRVMEARKVLLHKKFGPFQPLLPCGIGILHTCLELFIAHQVLSLHLQKFLPLKQLMPFGCTKWIKFRAGGSAAVKHRKVNAIRSIMTPSMLKSDDSQDAE